MTWTSISAEEMELRRVASVAAMKEKERAAWEVKYQEICDTMYWAQGKCCAGCDHWHSDMGLIGSCAAAGIVSGLDVIKSTGASFCSYTPPPGLPFTRAKFHCGKFSDAFDWSTLDRAYLQRIGAIRNGALRQKPQTVATKGGRK